MKKRKISKEENIIESFFPSDKDDWKITTEKSQKDNIIKEDYLKNAIEKKIKETPKEEILKTVIEKTYKKPDKKDLETVEKISNKTRRRKSIGKKTAKTTTKEIKFTIPKILLKKEGYELIITEKPQAALKIATALGKSTKSEINRIPYYEVSRNGKKLIVACAVGHLFTLKQKNGKNETPEFNISWVPNYLARKGDFSKKYYDVLLKLAKNAGSITVATDFDIEGEVIGLNVVRFICNQKDASRMKFSTLTQDELNKAYEEKSPTISWGQAIAGETRHYLDWFYGINLSRALMNAIKSTGRFKIMSIGRVQGPALNLIVQKEKQIQAFKPEPYWQVFITVKDEKKTDTRLSAEAKKKVAVQGLEENRRKPTGCLQLELKYIKDIFKEKELEKFKNLEGKTALAETRKSQQKLPPNPPFNLTTLQTEAYAFYGITPSKTLQIAQSLYLSGLISYPRTSSQKIPDSIAYKEILRKLSRKYHVEHLIKRTKPIEGKKTDSAHPSIYPTGNEQILSGQDEKIYNLTVKRFLSLFCEDAVIDNKTVTATLKEKNENLIFNVRGSSILKKSWLEIYPSKLKEKEIPDINREVKIIDSRIESKETQPPKRYSPASIISELEKRNLGTKCLTGNTKIIVNNQETFIQDLFKNSQKYKKEGDTEIKKLSNIKTISLNKKEDIIIADSEFISKRKIKENEKIIKIDTESSTIELTEDHLIYIYKNSQIQQIPAKNLSINDTLIGITKKHNEGKPIIKKSIFNNNYRINKNEIKHKFSSKTSKGILISKFPIKWSTSLAWVLGYYYGDGSYDGPKYNGSHSISFTTTEKKALNLLNENIENIFGQKPYAYNLRTKYKVNLNSVMAYALIKTFPELNGKNLINIPKEFIGDFLRGFFDADGNVHLRPKGITKIKGIKCNSFDTPRVKFTLANERLIIWVKDLLNQIGIQTKINKGLAQCNGKKFNCYIILISGRDKIEKFAYLIGFDSYKEHILYKGLKCASKNYKILQNSSIIALSLIKNPKNIKEIIQNTHLQKAQISYALKRLQKLKIVIKKKIGKYNWSYSLNKNYKEYLSHCIKIVYNKIAENVYSIPIKGLSIIKNYSGYVYDISVEEDSPNFVVEGNILVHNSTRASIIETLYDRGYVKEKSIQATSLGISLIRTLEKYSPIIIDEELTRKFEKEMESIQESKKKEYLEEKEEKVIDEAKEKIIEISKDFEKNEKKIGSELVEATDNLREQEKEENKLMPCPVCKKGMLTIMYSPKTKRNFVACDAYPACKTTFSLPPNGIIKKTDKVCEYCGFPMLTRISKGKRPWIFCFNPACKTNKERLEEYNKKKEES